MQWFRGMDEILGLLGDKWTRGRKLALMRLVKWALSLLAVPVIYVLSLPPLWNTTKWVQRTPGSKPSKPEWLLMYSRPYGYLAQWEPLYEFLKPYGRWCDKYFPPVN